MKSITNSLYFAASVVKSVGCSSTVVFVAYAPVLVVAPGVEEVPPDWKTRGSMPLLLFRSARFARVPWTPSSTVYL